MKEQYERHCASRQDIPLFLQPWWLDAVCGSANWGAVVSEKEGVVNGILPYFLTQKAGFRGIGMPPFTPFMGWHIHYPEGQRYTKRLSFEMKTAKELIENLPKTAFFEQLLPPHSTNWLPAKWLNYQQTTRYTYVLKHLEKEVDLTKGFLSGLRGGLQKAASIVEITNEFEPAVAYNLLHNTYTRQKLKMPMQPQQFEHLLQTCHARGRANLFLAKDERGQVHAAAVVVEDGHTAWNIIRAHNEQFAQNRAMGFLMWKVISKMAEKGIQHFDFSGSMLPGVEMFVRSFGAEQVPYAHLTKENSIPYFWLRRMNDFRRQFLTKP